jgi:phosphate transport system substrate-binding protein
MRKWIAAVSLTGLAFGSQAAGETLRIKGSNTFGEELGPALIKRYKDEAPDTTIALETLGTGTGIAALVDGTTDLASASRPATEDEIRRAKSRGVRLKSYTIGYYGVAVIVNEANPLKRLSDRQVASLFSGIVTDWGSLGGTPGKVVLFTRQSSAGAYLGFRELALHGHPYSADAQPCQSDQEIAQRVGAEVHAIGYVSFARLNTPNVHALSINLATPTRFEVNQSTYPYARGLRFYSDTARESTAVKRFVAFVRSKAGQDVLAEMGFVGFAETPMLPTMEP